jgi:hypothetical protein
MVCAMSDDTDKATDAASVADILKHIGRNRKAHRTPDANALADEIASQVALGRFKIRVMLRTGKAKSSMKHRCDAVTVGKPQTVDGVERRKN